MRSLLYKFTLALWWSLPSRLRASVYSVPLLEAAKKKGRDYLARNLGRDDIYNKTYYSYVDEMAVKSAAAISELILRRYAPKSVIDIGCGTGAVIEALRLRGVSVYGLEYSTHALSKCRERGLQVEAYDIESGNTPQVTARFDVVLCTEVAEHVKPKFADDLVSLLAKFAGNIVFTAAVPGQGGGVDHVNEQPNEYWIQKFESRGYYFRKSDTLENRQFLRKMHCAPFYAQNLMLFEKP